MLAHIQFIASSGKTQDRYLDIVHAASEEILGYFQLQMPSRIDKIGTISCAMIKRLANYI